jgi:hypothetical protein
MNPNLRWFRYFMLPFVLLTLLSPQISYGLSEDEIFAWVANRMEIQQDYIKPSVTLVDKPGIQKAFIEGNRKGYLRWESEYGRDRAQEILKGYLDEIVGLFIDKTQSIYVATFVSPCKQRAVLAHEFAHYFQYVTEGPILPGSFQEGIGHMTRELEAYRIEKDFAEAFCEDHGLLPVASLRTNLD